MNRQIEGTGVKQNRHGGIKHTFKDRTSPPGAWFLAHSRVTSTG